MWRPPISNAACNKQASLGWPGGGDVKTKNRTYMPVLFFDAKKMSCKNLVLYTYMPCSWTCFSQVDSVFSLFLSFFPCVLNCSCFLPCLLPLSLHVYSPSRFPPVLLPVFLLSSNMVYFHFDFNFRYFLPFGCWSLIAPWSAWAWLAVETIEDWKIKGMKRKTWIFCWKSISVNLAVGKPLSSSYGSCVCRRRAWDQGNHRKGQIWGALHIFDRVDPDFEASQFGMGAEDIQFAHRCPPVQPWRARNPKQSCDKAVYRIFWAGVEWRSPETTLHRSEPQGYIDTGLQWAFLGCT